MYLTNFFITTKPITKENHQEVAGRKVQLQDKEKGEKQNKTSVQRT